MIVESENIQTTLLEPTASAIGPCPTIIQISRTPRHWKFTQDHRTTRPPTKWCHTNVEATPSSTSVWRHSVLCACWQVKGFYILTYHKKIYLKKSPPQIPLSWFANGGCYCSPLKYCTRRPNKASHPTIHKCSGVQINLNLKFTTKTIPNYHLFIYLSIHLTYHKNCISNLHYPSIHPSIHPYIWLTTKTLKLTQIHPSIPSQTYTYPHIHPSCISNLHYPSFHPSIWLTTETISNLHYPSFHQSICLTTKTISNLYESILPSYFKQSLIHSSIHLSCISNLHFHCIHPSALPQKLSQTYTNPFSHPISNLH